MDNIGDISLSPVLNHWSRWLVAFSGGLDSTVLLHRLAQLREHTGARLRAIHVHHGLSRYADEWVAHCQRICERWNVPLEVIRVQLQDNGQGIEGQAREARYAAFAAALQPEEALITAQHLDDQCETLLLALKRGSGPAGLAAMPETLAFAGGTIVRPLLGCSRAVLEAYASANGLEWIEDDSNQDDRYDRNFLRLRVLPQLTQRWPYFARTAARSAALCGEQERLIDELLADELASLIGPQGELRLTPLAAMSDIRRAAVLRRWLVRDGSPAPSRSMLARLWGEVACARADAAPRLRLGELEVRRYHGALWRVTCRAPLDDVVLGWDDPGQPLVLPEALGILRQGEQGMAVRPPADGERVTVRFRASGTVHILGRAHGRPIKKLWQELGVAPWRRVTTPLLYYNECLIAAMGIFVTREGAPQGASCWRILWQKELMS
ncbi:tRNA lysidine(34) synthetase TilS [Erwinia sp. CPCC 100877]|nr:tRNA lysidine(34) synthetase TilS [Erwinia sp. CPCC 100877]